MQITKERVKEILAECLEISESELDSNMELSEEAGFDSIVLVSFILRLEEELQLDIDRFDEISHHLGTVEELLTYIVGWCEVGISGENIIREGGENEIGKKDL